MAPTGMSDPHQEDPRRKATSDEVDDDLIGLDPEDPEVQAFAEHLDRVQRVRPNYTVEGYLSGMSDFADGANRLGGHHRLMATILAMLILLGVAVAVWNVLGYLLGVLFN
jgi:hypothetical protein